MPLTVLLQPPGDKPTKAYDVDVLDCDTFCTLVVKEQDGGDCVRILLSSEVQCDWLLNEIATIRRTLHARRTLGRVVRSGK